MARISKKAQENRINALYTKRCSGIQIGIMDTVTIYKKAEAAIAAKPAITDEELGDHIYAATNAVRTN